MARKPKAPSPAPLLPDIGAQYTAREGGHTVTAEVRAVGERISGRLTACNEDGAVAVAEDFAMTLEEWVARFPQGGEA